MSDAPWFSSTMTNTCWMFVEVTLPSSWPGWVGIGSIGASSPGAAASSGSVGSGSVAQPVNTRTLLIAQTRRFMDSPPRVIYHARRVRCAALRSRERVFCLRVEIKFVLCPKSSQSRDRPPRCAYAVAQIERADCRAQSGRSGGALLARVYRPALDPAAHAED